MPATHSFPATLPRPLFGTWKESEPNLVLGTETDIGPIKTRLRATAGIASVSCQYLFSTVELATFRSFYTTTLAYGSVQFNMNHPWTNTALVWLFDPQTPPSYEAVSHNCHRVSVSLLRLVE